MQLALKRKNTSSPGMAASGRYSFVVVFLISLILFVQNVKSEDVVPADKPLTSIERLRLQLFTNYDKNAQPLHKLQISKVGIRLTVSYIDIDELNGKVTVHAWLALSWKDDHRSWNSSEYENITSMHIKSREVWHPDITLFNSAGDGNYVGDTMVILYSDGSFLFVPPVTYTAYCTLNLQMWPYDTQTCNLKLGTLNWDFIDVDALTNKTTLETEDVYKTTEWQIVDSHYNYTSEHYYNYIDFVFKLQRNSHMYGAVIFTPATCIIMLALCTFWLPPQMGEKILLNGVTIIIIVAFLMYFAQLLPIMAENTPLIVLFYSSSLLLVSISTIIAVIVLYLSMAKHKRRIPDFLKQLLNGRVGKGLLLAHFTLEAEQNESNMTRSKELGEQVFGESDTNDLIDTLGGHNQSAPSERAIQFDWVLLATAVDRLFFLAYCFLFFILGIVYII